MTNVSKIQFNAGDAAEQFVESLRQTGFAILQQHPIETELLQKVYSDWETFFTGEDKHHYHFNADTQDGFFPYLSENAKGAAQKDLKEFYHFYLWGQCPEHLRERTTELHRQLSALAEQLLVWVQEHSPAEIRQAYSMPLNKMVTESPGTLMRILNYPPLSGDENDGAIRAAAHEDINLLTCLVASTEPGLEVQDKQGNWHAIDCDPGNIAVNVGDMLQMCSSEHFPSTTHRVVNPHGTGRNRARLSIPLFLHPRPDVVLSDKYTAGSYLDERLQAIGLK